GRWVILGDEADAQQDVLRSLLGGHADGPYHTGERRLRDGDAVLHQHLSHIDVGTDLERYVQRVRAVVVALARHVHHLLDAVNLLLDRRGYGVGHNLSVGARVNGAPSNHRGRNLWILCNRQQSGRDASEQEDHDRKHTGQDWAVNKDAGEHG